MGQSYKGLERSTISEVSYGKQILVHCVDKFYVKFLILIIAKIKLMYILFEWWTGNYSITEFLPELIQQVRQDLAGALGGQP